MCSVCGDFHAGCRKGVLLSCQASIIIHLWFWEGLYFPQNSEGGPGAWWMENHSLLWPWSKFSYFICSFTAQHRRINQISDTPIYCRSWGRRQTTSALEKGSQTVSYFCIGIMIHHLLAFIIKLVCLVHVIAVTSYYMWILVRFLTVFTKPAQNKNLTTCSFMHCLTVLMTRQHLVKASLHNWLCCHKNSYIGVMRVSVIGVIDGSGWRQKEFPPSCHDIYII